MQQYILQSLIGTNFLLFFFFCIWLKQKLLAREAQEDRPIEIFLITALDFFAVLGDSCTVAGGVILSLH